MSKVILPITSFLIRAAAHAQNFPGPLVGHATDTSAQIRFWAAPTATPLVNVSPTCTVALSHDGESWTAKLSALKRETDYKFEITIGGLAPSKGSFTSAPESNKPTTFAFALSSCMNFEAFPQQPSWKEMSARNPAFHILCGDTVYADWKHSAAPIACDETVSFPEKLRNKYFGQFAVADFAKHVAHCPTYATWDDHDFICDDEGGMEHIADGKREQSLTVFKQMFANPDYGEPTNPGTYFSFRWGDVDFFVLDVRYYRTQPGDANESLLGTKQEEWLTNAINGSNAAFKFIVSGTSWNGRKGEAGWECWTNYVSAKVLSDVIDNAKGRVVFLSGDLHLCAFYDHSTATKKPFYEFVSSGIGTYSEDVPPRKLVGSFIVFHVDTKASDPSIQATIVQSDGTWERRRTITQTGTVSDE